MDKRIRWNKGQELGQFLPVPSIRANKWCHSPKRNSGKQGFKGKIVGPILKVLGLWAYEPIDEDWQVDRYLGWSSERKLNCRSWLENIQHTDDICSHESRWSHLGESGVRLEGGLGQNSEKHRIKEWRKEICLKKKKEWGVVSREVKEKPRVVGVTEAKWRTRFEEIVSTPLNGA